MPTLQQLTDQPGDDPTLIVDQPSSNQIEPLGGPVSVDDLMDRFPDTVYDQSRDTHLYKFISALCGDAGAGLLKKQSFVARLRNEGDLLTFRDLDTFYVQHLRFPRLRSEMYPNVDPSTDVLTKSEWDEVQRCDLLYYHRVQLFMHSTRLGSSPQGMQLAAEAGSGVHCDVIENYKAVYDINSDDPLGLEIQGVTNGIHEFIIQPELQDNAGTPNADITYQADINHTYDYATDTYTVGDAGTDTWTHSVGAYTNMDPAIERNMVEVLDRLRPAAAVMSTLAKARHYSKVDVDNADASSGRITVTRYTTGSPDVEWPEVSTTKGTFIVAGSETETTALPLSQVERPTIYHTMEFVSAYTEQALSDPLYNTIDFPTNLPLYQSEHLGPFLPILQQIYTFLQKVPTDDLFDDEKALAIQNTPLLLQGSYK